MASDLRYHRRAKVAGPVSSARSATATRIAPAVWETVASTTSAPTSAASIAATHRAVETANDLLARIGRSAARNTACVTNVMTPSTAHVTNAAQPAARPSVAA